MRTALTKLRRLVASLMLATLAVIALANSAHAGLHASCASQGAVQHLGQAGFDQATPDEASTAQGDTSTVPDPSGCSCCCHGVALGLTPGDTHSLILPCLDRNVPRLAELALSSTRPEGPIRPPRHP